MTSNSPIQRLPPEVLHMIFKNLPRYRRGPVPELRLLCKCFADIGLHYLLTSYHLIFKKSSFERLLEISQHPVLSKCVKSIFYEADVLCEYDTMEEWKANIDDHYCPDLNKLSSPSEEFSEKQFREAYRCYRECISDQRKMISLAYNAPLFNDAIQKLPNLVSLEMSLDYCLTSRTECMDNAFSPTLYKPGGDPLEPDHQGVAQLRSLLLCVLDSSRRIEELRCGYVDWKFFKAEAEVFARLKLALQHLRVLDLFISTTSSRDDDDDLSNYHQAIVECAAYLEEGRLRDFVSAAPNLTDLFLEFDSNVPQSPARLVDIVGTTTWPSLHYVHFSLLSCTIDGLIEFYRRHSTTLKNIGFDDIKLLQGTWQDLFPKIKETLKLKYVKIAGCLWEPAVQYDFGMPSRAACLGDKPPLVKKYVERYLLDNSKYFTLPDLSEIVEYEQEHAFWSGDSDLDSTDNSEDMLDDSETYTLGDPSDDSEIYTLDGSEASSTEDQY